MANYRVTKRIIKDKNGNTKGEINCIIADVDKLTREEEKAIQIYLKAGYKMFPKEHKKETGKGLTKEKMKEMLKDNPEGLKELNKKLEQKENFMKITKWFRKEFVKESK